MVNDVHKQNKKVTIFAIFLSIISIGLLIFGFSLVSSDKVVLLQSISNLYGKLENSFENNNELLDKLATSKNVGIRSNINLISDNNNIGLSLDYLENKENKKSSLDLDISINNEKLIGGDLALANNNVYFSVDDITPNYYYTALEYLSFISSLNSNDYDKIIDLLKDSITDNVSEDNIKKEKVTINYNKKDKKVNKITYEVTNKALKKSATKFIDSIKKDKKLLDNIASYLNVEVNDLVKGLDSFLEDFKIEKEEVLFNYVVYYYGFNKIVGYELVSIESNLIFEYKIQDKESIILTKDSIKVLVINIKKDKNKNTFDGYINDDEEKIEFYGTISNNKLIINLVNAGQEVKFEFNSNNIENDNSFATNSKMVLSTIINGNETILGSLEFNVEYYFDEEVSVNLDNSVDINSITEEDYQVIYNNLMNHPLYQYVGGFMSGLQQM